MRSAHVFYRATTIPVEPIIGVDGVLILSPLIEELELCVLAAGASFLVLLSALSLAWPA